MVTRLFLRNATDSTTGLPTTEQSSKATPTELFVPLATNRQMLITKGAGPQVEAAKNMTNNSTMVYMGRWVTPALAAQTVSANTWTLNFAARESGTSYNFPVLGTAKPLWVNIYIWRPSTTTKIATLLDGNTNSNFDEPSASATIKVMHGTLATVAGTAQQGDVICFELWTDMTHTPTQGVTHRIYWEGSVVTTVANTTVTDHASFLETPQDLVFYDPTAQVNMTVTPKVLVNKFITKV